MSGRCSKRAPWPWSMVNRLNPEPPQLWTQLIGVAKYLLRTGDRASRAQLRHKFRLSPASLALGVEALRALGFAVVSEREGLSVSQLGAGLPSRDAAIATFLAAVAEEQFQRQYFYHVPIETLRAVLGDRAGTAF